MHTWWRWSFVVAVVLIAGAAWAQERRLDWLGARMQDVTKEEAEKRGWETPRGAKVDLTAGAPAAAAELQPGDVIVTLDGVEVENGS